jgi:aspartate aminotransferase-like enzyme
MDRYSQLLAAKGFAIYHGLTETASTFRVGHIGALTVPLLESFLEAAKQSLQEMQCTELG